MQSANDLNTLTLIANASLVVQLVLAVLLIFTITSWYLIARKWMMYQFVKFHANRFEKKYANNTNIALIYSEVLLKKYKSPLETIFIVGVEELKKVTRSKKDEKIILVDNISRAMTTKMQKEIDVLEGGLNVLATIGSVSPYIGLFGTVWGIMHAFQSLANVGQATLSQVAPGIAEALVATAIGLFAAIPAVLAYNYFSDQVYRLNNRFESFIDEFKNVVSLHLH